VPKSFNPRSMPAVFPVFGKGSQGQTSAHEKLIKNSPSALRLTVRSQAIPGNGGHNNYGRGEKSSDQSVRKIGLFFSSWSQRSAP
jgi:hypothetical protein